MTDEQFERFMSMMQSQTEALQAQTKALEKISSMLSSSQDGSHSDLCSEIKFLRKAEILKGYSMPSFG